MPPMISPITNRSTVKHMPASPPIARLRAPASVRRCRIAYGSTEIEKLDIFRYDRPKAPIFVFIPGGNWFLPKAFNAGYAAEMLTHAGAHYVDPAFRLRQGRRGDLTVLATQVR